MQNCAYTAGCFLVRYVNRFRSSIYLAPSPSRLQDFKMTKSLVDASRVNQQDQLSNTGHTIEFILRTLYENNPVFVKLLGDDKVVKIDSYDVSAGKGYCSRVFKTSIWIGDVDQKPYTFIMKIPTTEAWNEMGVEFSEDEKQNNEETIKKMHNAEVDAYELLKDLNDFPKPQVYHTEKACSKKAGYIMMNDLSGGFGASLGIFYTVTEKQCYNLAKHMVDFQIYADFMKGKPWFGKFTENLHANSDIEKTWMQMLLPVLNYEDQKLAEKVKFLIRLDPLKLGKYSTESRAEEIGCTTLGRPFLTLRVSSRIVPMQKSEEPVKKSVVDFFYDYLAKRYKEHGKEPNLTREQAHELYELAFVQQTLLFGIMFGLMGLPLKDSKDKTDHAKLAKMALRFNLLLDDAILLIDKYPALKNLMKKE
ncbi:hypothetical protein M3Y97_00155700 [Aphelenchoides bicaudatus]|nr:hypothetical protein M3Y97_00155700 [Aphelenchoides bicaudatus]